MKIDIRILEAGDASMLENVAQSVFDNAIDPAWAEEFLADRRHHLALALAGDLVVGMATAIDHLHADKPVELYIDEIGVAPKYQRAGIGRRLLEALLKLGGELGCRQVWLATELDNEAARRLYTAAGGRSERIVMYSFGLIDRPPK